jgi:hypothetical protein
MLGEAYALYAEASTTMVRQSSAAKTPGSAAKTPGSAVKAPSSKTPRSGSGVKTGRGGRGGKERGEADSEARFLEDSALEEIEREHPEGLTLAQVIDAFASRGMHLSEATFRKYVQYGLLGRSRRVGRKGKHQGSLGLYPATTVRRVNAIKQMMGANYTIEDIQRSFLRFTDEIDGLRRGTEKLFSGFENELSRGSFPAERKRGLQRELTQLRKATEEVLGRVESLERQLVSPLERAARERAFGSGAKGGSEELL